MGLSLVGLKCLNIGVDVAVALIGAALPFWFKGNLFFSLGNSFAGGVFLTVGLVHMLPDAQQSFDQYLQAKGSTDDVTDYPWVFSIATFGCLLTLMVEKFKPPHDHSDNTLRTPLNAIAEEEEEDGSDETDSLLAPARPDHKARMPAVLLLIVLSLHSFLAGLAVGTSDSMSSGFTLMIAIVAHKGFAAFALGIAMQKSGFRPFYKAVNLCVFVFMTPIGIAVGIALTVAIKDSVALLGLVGVVESLATGTFLTVALEDIIGEEMRSKENLPLKFGMVFLGWMAMGVVAWWT